MEIKILFFDDIFSDLFRGKHAEEELAWDDNWIDAISKSLDASTQGIGVSFELIKSGEIDAWEALIKKESPDIVLIDLFWVEQAQQKYNDRNRAIDISLDVMQQIRKAFPDLPVVCYTIKPNYELMERAYKSGATFFLEKVALAIPEVHSSLKYIFIHLIRQVQKEFLVMEPDF
ncbi:response regulator [Desulfosarcina ovata]|uniref:Response regulatory domain-containing protein n=1 Tax=Desulfosarcina ovata subsp. ovata TaxID=2752305 RepID=A0A5K8A2U1_9BACT|nr:response regulator [Desulfosarcina ovata]BBO86839.1 hypothetical protein DSCOOX_00190 [Desulfosarcina ovata subsp. ovata]